MYSFITDWFTEIPEIKAIITNGNSQNSDRKIDYSDFDDGLIVLRLIDRINPFVVQWRHARTRVRHKFDKLGNCNIAVKYCKDMKIAPVGFGAMDIADGNQKFINSLLLIFYRYYVRSIIPIYNFFDEQHQYLQDVYKSNIESIKQLATTNENKNEIVNYDFYWIWQIIVEYLIISQMDKDVATKELKKYWENEKDIKLHNMSDGLVAWKRLKLKQRIKNNDTIEEMRDKFYDADGCEKHNKNGVFEDAFELYLLMCNIDGLKEQIDDKEIVKYMNQLKENNGAKVKTIGIEMGKYVFSVLKKDKVLSQVETRLSEFESMILQGNKRFYGVEFVDLLLMKYEVKQKYGVDSNLIDFYHELKVREQQQD